METKLGLWWSAFVNQTCAVSKQVQRVPLFDRLGISPAVQYSLKYFLMTKKLLIISRKNKVIVHMKAKIFEMFLTGYKITHLKFKKKKEYMFVSLEFSYTIRKKVYLC